ncbi:MAG: DEAD/DEAH box helicase [Ignavibacteriales bacterium]|nr:DEAD/DEAH box helicase [Ignavibacteriales bacterium]
MDEGHKIPFQDLINKGRNTWLIETGISTKDSIEFEIASAPAVNANYDLLFRSLLQFSENNYKIIIAVENEIQHDRLRELIYNQQDEFGLMIEEGTIIFTILPLKEGFFLKKEKVLFLSDYQIFGKPFRTKVINYKKAKKSRRNELGSIKPGDFVVHEEYGIGRYAGLHNVKIGEIEQESMKLIYGEGGAVFVNLNYLHLVKKYSSKEGVEPRTNVLGTTAWENAKTRAKRKIREIARDLIELYAQRKSSQGFAFAGDTKWQKELEASFIYEDTPDQLKVTDEIKQDMEDRSPMDRLVCGDVGFGKTEIAVRAAFKAVQDNKQVSVLVPTTILAEQHYNTFRDRLSQFPVKIEVMSRFQNKANQKIIVEKLKTGEVDIVIGTHRLISKDIGFKDLGLLIIDEEHRFGVKAKEKLRSIRVNVDTLTLTATPFQELSIFLYMVPAIFR